MARVGTAHLPLHGGKDKIPYAVDRVTYDRSIHILHAAVERAKLGDAERLDAIKRLERDYPVK